MAAAGAALGGGFTRHPFGILLGAVAGAVIGHAIDSAVIPRCQACGVALNLVNSVL